MTLIDQALEQRYNEPPVPAVQRRIEEGQLPRPQPKFAPVVRNI